MRGRRSVAEQVDRIACVTRVLRRRDDQRPARAAAPGRAHPAAQRRRDVRRGQHRRAIDLAELRLRRMRMVTSPALVRDRDIGEIVLGDAELVKVALRGLRIERRNRRAVRNLELRIRIGFRAHRDRVDEQLGRVALQAQHVLGAARRDHLRRDRERRRQARAVHRQLARDRHRHLHVRDEDVAPLRALVGPGRAPREHGVDLVLADARVGERVERRLGGQLQRVLAIRARRVGVAHADDRRNRTRSHGCAPQTLKSGCASAISASRSARLRSISRLHSLRCTTSPRWLYAWISIVPTPNLSSLSFFAMTSAVA